MPPTGLLNQMLIPTVKRQGGFVGDAPLNPSVANGCGIKTNLTESAATVERSRCKSGAR
jgi:hypothetical protein